MGHLIVKFPGKKFNRELALIKNSGSNQRIHHEHSSLYSEEIVYSKSTYLPL